MSIVNREKYKKRIIDVSVERYLKRFGSVCIEGPKWCGKTWTASFHSNSEFLISSAEGNYQNKRLAEMSPFLVLEGDSPRLIDEWQDVPSLWDAVRIEVDKRDERGQFILTGSAGPKAKKKPLHSGAGRIGKLRMNTMSLFETGDSTGDVSLKELCEDGIVSPKLLNTEISLKKIVYYITRGGWPGNQDADPEDALLLPDSYVKAILDKDIYEFEGETYDRKKMLSLLRSLARNESTTISNNKLLEDIKDHRDESLSENTVSSYLSALDRLFLINNQQPFSSNIRSSVRVKNMEKRHLVDTSLACSLLNATPERLLGDLNTLGFLFESLCIHDLRIYADFFDAKVMHYQDYKDREIDAVVEMRDGSWCAFEIKLGANQIESAAKNLLKIKSEIEKDDGIPPKELCVISGMANAIETRPDGVHVIPITALKN